MTIPLNKLPWSVLLPIPASGLDDCESISWGRLLVELFPYLLYWYSLAFYVLNFYVYILNFRKFTSLQGHQTQIDALLIVMSSSWNFLSWAEPSWKGSKPSRIKLGHFNFHTTYRKNNNLEKWAVMGLNGFHIKWIIGTHCNWKNQNPGSSQRAPRILIFSIAVGAD